MPIDLVFSCVCPVIDHEFRHNIVKVASRGSADYSYCKKFNCSHPFEALHFKLLVMKYYQVLKNFPFNFLRFFSYLDLIRTVHKSDKFLQGTS